MNNTEFLFWLQGYFEIRMNTESPLTIIQVPIIRDHIKLVEDENSFSGEFITGLKTTFEVYDTLLGVVELNPLLRAITTVIKTNLVKEFEKKTPTRDRPSLTLPDHIFRQDMIYTPHTPCVAPQIIISDRPPGLAPNVFCEKSENEVWSSPGGNLTCSKLDAEAIQELLDQGPPKDVGKTTTFNYERIEQNNLSPNSPPGSC